MKRRDSELLGKRGRATRVVSLLLAVLLVPLLAGCFGGGSKERKGALTTSSAQAPGPKPAKDAHTKLSPGDSREIVDVKFAEGSDVRLRGNHLVSLSGGRIAELDDALAPFPGVTISRLFESASEEQLAAKEKVARARSGREQADLNLFFRLHLRRGTDTAALIDALNALDIVEIAAPAPKPAPPPVTPSFVPRQVYRTAATSGGIDADYAQTLAGGKGDNVTVVDIEYSWNRSHEDLSKARSTGAALANGTPCDLYGSTDHGTAVLGELTGDSNSFGITGLAAAAPLRTVNASRLDATGKCVYDLANAISLAADNTSLGDVILIEQQLSGPNWKGDPNSQVGDVPVEWDYGVWVAIQNATSLGRIVIEPAGNGYQNLDDPVYNVWNGTNWFSHDSRAIMVGAGNAPNCMQYNDPTARDRLSYSNYGSRVDVQGWGDCVTTTGYGRTTDYGSLQGGTDANLWYTGGFSGTSSASPIVAGAAAVLSSVAESRGTILPPATVRSLLRSTGQAQVFGRAGNIGPLPNLKAAIDALGPKLTESGHVVEGANLGTTTVPVRESWSSSGSAPAQYDVRLSTDGSIFVKQTLSSPTSSSAVFSLERNHNYRFAARAADADGIWGDWAYGTTFSLGEYQENYSSTNPLFTGTWTRAAWQSASDGYLSVSATAGDKVAFTFTGTNVAWVATKSSNRGQADVYVDGSFVKTVDLYSATTTSAQLIAYSRSWSQSGSHTIEVRVRGTADHPKVDADAFVRLR